MTNHALIFDLDNTLVNRRLSFQKYTEIFIDEFIVVPMGEERLTTSDYIRAADKDGYRPKREFYQELLNHLKWKKEAGIEELLNFWFSEFSKCTLLMEGAIEVIESVKSAGFKLGVITNGSVQAQYAKLDQVGLTKYFDAIIVSDEVNVKKPDRKIFEIALQRLNLPAEDCWYIGDHPANDIQGAADAGLNTIWLRGFQDWDARLEPPEFIVDRLEQLIDIVQSRT